jgi:hypothetical protein
MLDAQDGDPASTHHEFRRVRRTDPYGEVEIDVNVEMFLKNKLAKPISEYWKNIYGDTAMDGTRAAYACGYSFFRVSSWGKNSRLSLCMPIPMALRGLRISWAHNCRIPMWPPTAWLPYRSHQDQVPLKMMLKA